MKFLKKNGNIFTCNELVQELGHVPVTQLEHVHALELTCNAPVGHELEVG